MPGPMLNLNPISPFSATMIMATPIEIVKSAVGYDAIKSEVTKMRPEWRLPNPIGFKGFRVMFGSCELETVGKQDR